MKTCERCGGEVSWTNDTVGLYGGVVAHLCAGCLRVWNTEFKMSDAYKHLLSNKARRDYLDGRCQAGQEVSEEEWLDLVNSEAFQVREAAALANKFVQPAKVTA